MDPSTRAASIASLCLAILAVSFSACEPSEDHTMPGFAAFSPETTPCLNPDGWPGDSGQFYFGECSDSLHLIWDGAFLKVEHFCSWRNCSFDFVATYQVGGNHLFLYEGDASDLSAGCDCPYNLSYIVPAEPGSYRFSLHTMDAGGEPRSPRFAGNIDLPAGEDAVYEY